MRQTLLLALFLAACDGVDTRPAATEASALPAPPPGAGGLTLEIDGAALPGALLNVRITGAQPGERVFFARGTGEDVGALCPPILGGGCVDLRSPSLVDSELADGSGEARLALRVPPSIPAGAVGWFQAVSPSATSNTVAKFNPNDTGALYSAVFVRGQFDPGGSSSAVIGRGFFGIPTGLDWCSFGFSFTEDPAAPTTCPSCDFEFGTTTAGISSAESSWAGDCTDLLGGSPFGSYTTYYGYSVGVDLTSGTATLNVLDPYGTYTLPMDGGFSFNPTTGYFRAQQAYGSGYAYPVGGYGYFVP